MTRIHDMDKYLDDKAELLRKFKLKIKYFIITNEAGNDIIKVIATAGTEVIMETGTHQTFEDVIKQIGASTTYMPICEDTRDVLPYRYTNTKFDITKLEELAKYKSIKKISKNKAMDINLHIKSKQELEKEMVYVTNRKPITNSLALAKQFKLKHFQVIEKLFELGSMYPSVLMKIKYDVYSTMIKQSSKAKSEITGDRPSIEYSILGTKTVTERETYDIFYHVPEDVYYQFVKKLGTPKGLDTDAGKEKLIFIEDKQDEYFNAFKEVRERLYSEDKSEKEIEALFRERTVASNSLAEAIIDFTKHRNNLNGNKLNLDNVFRLVRNICNYKANISKIGYSNNTDDRKTRKEVIQEALIQIEFYMASYITTAKRFDLTLHQAIMGSFNMVEDDIINILKEYDVLWLYDVTKEY